MNIRYLIASTVLIAIVNCAYARSECSDRSQISDGKSCDVSEQRKQAIYDISKQFNIDMTKCKRLPFAVNLLAEAREQTPSESISPEKIRERIQYTSESLKFVMANCEAAEKREQQIKEAWDRQNEKQSHIAELTAIQDAERQRLAAERQRLAALPKAKIGMTAKQVLDQSSWGSPDKINRTTTAQGFREQWVYRSDAYLYFTNGKLTAIQNSY